MILIGYLLLKCNRITTFYYTIGYLLQLQSYTNMNNMNQQKMRFSSVRPTGIWFNCHKRKVKDSNMLNFELTKHIWRLNQTMGEFNEQGTDMGSCLWDIVLDPKKIPPCQDETTHILGSMILICTHLLCATLNLVAQKIFLVYCVMCESIGYLRR